MEILHVPVEGRVIALAIRRLRNARRISLRLSAGRDSIVLTLPVRASVATGMKFFHSKTGWVLAHIHEGRAFPFEEGSILPINGRNVTLRREPGRGTAVLSETELTLFCAPEFVKRRATDFLKKHMHSLCRQKASQMAACLGKSIKTVKIRDMKSRWGSCARDGTLTFHWQLLFAPEDVLDYLIAHEVAHLKEMNHSERFWKVVAGLCPGYAAAQKWLKRDGHQLHRYG